MTNIEKQHIIDSNDLSGEFYFTSILQEAYACGLLKDSDIQNIQLQCINFLAYKCNRYNSGDSSSIRVEAAENIMKSNLYTIGLYLKSLPDTDFAVSEIKRTPVLEMYQKGRKIINAKLFTAKYFYKLVQRNRLSTLNYTYNATVNDNGIGSFFESYNPDYEAHETIASIDYQLCNNVTDLAGVEYILKYLENIFLENEFCRNFSKDDIHHLLYGYDEGYKDLLINIFEQVLTAALGCSLANRSIKKLDVLPEEIQCLYNELSKYDVHSRALKIKSAAEKILENMNISSIAIRRYVEKSLPKIISKINDAASTNTLNKTFVSPVNPDLKHKIQFSSGAKMDDCDYRKLIDELRTCRYSPDKLALMKEKVKSFDDFEDMLFDAQLSREEIISALGILGEIEIAALIKRHQYKTIIQAVDLSEAEQALRLCLKMYIDQLSADKQQQIFKAMNQLIDD